MKAIKRITTLMMLPMLLLLFVVNIGAAGGSYDFKVGRSSNKKTGWGQITGLPITTYLKSEIVVTYSYGTGYRSTVGPFSQSNRGDGIAYVQYTIPSYATMVTYVEGWFTYGSNTYHLGQPFS